MREAKAAASLQELGTPLLEVFLAQDEAGRLRAQPVSLRPPSAADDIRSGARCAAPPAPPPPPAGASCCLLGACRRRRRRCSWCAAC
jgi:hypothetical protein